MNNQQIDQINRVVDDIMTAITIVERVGRLLEQHNYSDDDPIWDEYDDAVEAANKAVDYIYYLKYLFNC